MKYLPVFVTTGALLCLALTLVSAQEKRQRPDPGKLARENVERIEESTSLRWNAEVVESLALCEGEDVVPKLLELYEKPPEYCVASLRYIVATQLRMRFSGVGGRQLQASESDTELLRKFIKRNRCNPEHAWAIHCFAGVLGQQHDSQVNLELYEILGDDDCPAATRVGILEALSESDDDSMQRVLEIMLNEKYKDSAEDCVMLETAVWAAARAFKPKFSPGQELKGKWRKLFDKISDYLEDKKLHSRTRREIALALQHCFDTQDAYPWRMMWQQLFLTGKDPQSNSGKTFAKFMGMEIEGERIVFLIDASDSMLNPLSDEEKDAVRAPTTGDRGDDKLYEIDWSKVSNRFDAAREHLKWTLARLPANTKVSVVLFGSDVQVLGATPTFVELKRNSLSRIYASIDAVKPTEPSAEQASTRPHGVLMGETNYYQAFLAAYRMGPRAVVDEAVEHYDLKFILGGADSIVLLSDGVPNRDGFSGKAPLGSIVYSESHATKQPGEGYWLDVPAREPRPEREVEERDPETGEIVKRRIPG